jgi:hypothetical protein
MPRLLAENKASVDPVPGVRATRDQVGFSHGRLVSAVEAAGCRRRVAPMTAGFGARGLRGVGSRRGAYGLASWKEPVSNRCGR